MMEKVVLGEYVKIRTGKLDANASVEEGIYPFFTCAKEISKIDTYAFDCEAVLVAGNGELNVKYYEGKFNAYQRTYVIESTDKAVLSIKYLFYFLDTYIEKLRNGSIGGVIKYIKIKHLTDIELPIPDLETQNKIVTILDKVKSILDKREETIQKYDELLRTTFLDMFGNPMERPNKWEIDTIDRCLISITSGKSYGGDNKKELEDDELGVLKVSAVTKGIFDPKEYKAVKKDEITNNIIHPQKGDLLFSRANTLELVGATCIVDNDYQNLFLPDKLWKIDIDETIIKKVYLHYVLQNKDVRRSFLSIATGSSGSMLNISMDKFRKIVIPYPPIELQKEFETRYLIYIELTKKLKSSHQFIKDLYNSLSQLAFKGELEFGKGIDLEILLDNDYVFFKENSNKKSIQQLLEKVDKNELNKNKFYNPELYDKAKSFVFELLKNGEIEQVFDDKTSTVKLKLK